MSDESRLEINWINALGSALGAVSSAVVLSSLGTAGTLVGAAIGSLVITVGGALYAHSLQVARQRIVVTRTVLVRGYDADAVAVDGGDAEARVAGSRWSADRWKQVVRELPWRRVVAASVALFVVAMAVIVAFELTTGRPVSSYTGGTSDTGSGTTVPGIGGGNGPDDERTEDDDPPEPSPTDESGEEPTPQEPTPTPTATPTSPTPVEETTPPTLAPTEPVETAP